MQRVFTFILIFIFASVSAFAAEPIAVIIDVSGEASVGREGERGTTALSLKSQVYTKDVVYTGADGRVRLLFNDDSVVTVSSDSELYLADFAYTAREKKFNARLAKGAMRVITGEITERNPEGFNISTPHVSAGIRGTILNFLVTDSLTEVAVLNTDKAVVVNGQEIRENQRIIVGDGAAPQIAPITAEEKGAILSGGVPTASALTEDGAALTGVSEDLSKTLLQTQPTTGTIKGEIGGNYTGNNTTNPPLATLSGTFMVNFNLKTYEVLNASTSGTWAGISSAAGISDYISSGKWSASGGTGFGEANSSDCPQIVCFYVDTWKNISVEQDTPLGIMEEKPGVEINLSVSITDTAVGTTIDKSKSRLGLITPACTGGTKGCFGIVNAISNQDGNVSLVDGEKGTMSGSVVSHD